MKLNARAQEVLDELLEGNRRFRGGEPRSYQYSQGEIFEISRNQVPKAAIVACSDSRVSPELIFDQPLGSIFASRVPGNVASDSAKWMLDIAVLEFKLPLVMVMGHTGCLAIGQLLDGDKGGAGGMLRFSVLSAIEKARQQSPTDFYRAAVEQNVKQTVEELMRESKPLIKALEEGMTCVVGAIYEMETGIVHVLDFDTEE